MTSQGHAGPGAPDPEVRWVDDDRGLTELVKVLLDEPAYGLDTEFMSERTYWPKLCLVQVSWTHGVALVDPLACDVRALADVLHSPATMVTHAGASDLPILEHDDGLALASQRVRRGEPRDAGPDDADVGLDRADGNAAVRRTEILGGLINE